MVDSNDHASSSSYSAVHARRPHHNMTSASDGTSTDPTATRSSSTAAAAPISSLHHQVGAIEASSSKPKFEPLELESGDSADAAGGDNDEDLVHPLVGSSHHHSSNGDTRDSPSKSHKAVHHDDDGHGTAPPGSATTSQMIINIVISFVGAGLLGIPNAFSKAGWLLGSLTLLTVSALNVYAMLCLPAVQVTLQRQYPNEAIQSYGDLGRVILGHRGEKAIFVCLGISQAGFATAYIIFIAANLHSIYDVSRGLVCLVCVPGLALLVQFRDLKSLSPFSLLANTANFCALSAVLFQDYESYTPHNDTIHKVKWGGLLYVIAITIYSMEGVGLILSLKASGKKPENFSFLLMATLTVISLFMVVFGSAGYWAFGDSTLAPITLNMTSHWSATFVKCALCLGLYLTYPIMMFPIWSICENSHAVFQQAQARILLRASLVVISALVAYGVPNFGKFLSLVGSSICTLLGFVFPMYFHLYTLGKELPLWQKALDVGLLVGGFSFGVLGTWQSLVAMLQGELEGEV